MQPSLRPSAPGPFALARVGLVTVLCIGGFLGLFVVYFSLPLLILPAFLGVYLVWRFKGHFRSGHRGPG